MVSSASHTEAQVQTCLTFQQLHDKAWNKNAINVVFAETNLKIENASSQVIRTVAILNSNNLIDMSSQHICTGVVWLFHGNTILTNQSCKTEVTMETESIQ